MKRAAFALSLTFAALAPPALAQTVIEMAAGEVKIIDVPAMFDRIIMPPNEIAEVSPVGGRRLSVIGYKPGRFNLVAMRGEAVAASFWVQVQDVAFYERRAVTVYRNARPHEIHTCSLETGACVFYKDLRPPPPPIISTGPVITEGAIRAGQGQSGPPVQ
jgi:hypothetical protein